MNCYFFIRTDQGNETSLETQQEQCESYALANNLDVLGTWRTIGELQEDEIDELTSELKKQSIDILLMVAPEIFSERGQFLKIGIQMAAEGISVRTVKPRLDEVEHKHVPNIVEALCLPNYPWLVPE